MWGELFRNSYCILEKEGQLTANSASTLAKPVIGQEIADKWHSEFKRHKFRMIIEEPLEEGRNHAIRISLPHQNEDYFQIWILYGVVLWVGGRNNFLASIV
jgi:hypothetical protein